MKKENKKKNNKKKNYWKIFLGIGVTVAGIWAVNKLVPGFNENIIKPVKGFTKNIASDVKESVLREEAKLEQEQIKKDQKKRFSKEISINSESRKNFNNKMNRCGNNNRRERFGKKNFN